MKRILMTSLSVFLILGATVSMAQTMSSLVEGTNGGIYTSDPQGPSASTVSSALTFPGTSTLDFGREGFGRAKQSPDGVAAVVADALFANGDPSNDIESRTIWSTTETNTSVDPMNYIFSFLITPPSLRIGDYAGLSELSIYRPDISFQVVIRANGVPVFDAGANLIGGSISHVLNESGTSLSPNFVGGGSEFGYDFQSYFDNISLGPIAAGASLTVEYEMIVRVDSPGFESGGRAQIGDPFDLDGAPGFTGILVEDGTVETEPATWSRVKNLYSR